MSLINLTTQINQELSEATDLQVYISHLPQQGKLPLLVVEYSDVDKQKCNGKVVLSTLTVNVILFVQFPMDVFTYTDMIENYFNDMNMKKIYTSPTDYDSGIYYKEFRFESVVKTNSDGTYEVYHK